MRCCSGNHNRMIRSSCSDCMLDHGDGHQTLGMGTRACRVQVDKVSKFTSHLVDELRATLKTLTAKADKEMTDAGKKQLLQVGRKPCSAMSAEGKHSCALLW